MDSRFRNFPLNFKLRNCALEHYYYIFGNQGIAEALTEMLWDVVVESMINSLYRKNSLYQ